MKLNELLNTCQNTWKNLFTHDTDFKVHIYGRNGRIITLNGDYQNCDEYYKINNLKVAFWEMRDIKKLVIKLDY